MAFVTNTRGTVRTDIFARLSAFFANASDRMEQYRVYRRTMDELQGLSDRELTDLGLNRTMLASIAHEAAYKNA
ncbi:DUF1127 domain-containing protein [Oceaniglobus ichthyenteri]|uniref:DUF1127 domain-containing protein n=1 Tax=Oceaniglobus ichthyenteri TaxID=2136177 RepID=UPI000D3C0D95|nr:DUF1127 domain-containing protein [Oceaniglobus ichthyenteri]